MTDRLEVYRSDNDGQWYWRRIDQGNHEKLAQGEGYTRRADALTGALRANPDITEVVDIPSDYNTEVDG